MTRLLNIFVILFFIIFELPAYAVNNSLQASPFKEIHGYFDVNGYYDTRSFDVLTVNTLIDTPFWFQYYSFINIFGNPSSADKVSLNNYYTEQNFRITSMSIPVELATQYVTATKFRDVWRFGPRIRMHDIKYFKSLFKKLHLIYTPTFFPLQYDRSPGYDALIEHFYRVDIFPKLFNNRLYIAGFFDHSLLFGSDNRKDHSKLVAENQIGVRLIKQLYVVAEYRFNGFFKSKKHGLGIGLEYLFKF